MTKDDLPIDGISLEEVERASQEYKLDEKQARMLLYIKKNLPISGFSEVLTEELWLREVLKDIDRVGFARTQALRMLGEYLGILGKRVPKSKSVNVVFDEEGR